MTGLSTTFRSLRWSRLLCVALVLVASLLMGNAARALPTQPVDAAASTISMLPVAVPELALPADPALTAGLLNIRAISVVFSALLAAACCLWVQTLLRGWISKPRRAVPGRRGRALLHAYLN
jgi:hypothetical protein